MQRSTPWVTSVFICVSVLAVGCSGDVGTCDDAARGRTTVAYGRGVAYTGQALLLASCATGCHSSDATGEARRGAPADLDFNVRPIDTPAPAPALMGATGAVVGVQVDSAQLAGLRARQRKVFEQRNAIWDQIEKGLMPPGGGGLALMSAVRTVFRPDSTCIGSGGLANDAQAKEELRNWLACGAPVVEASSALLPVVAPAATNPADVAAGAAAYTGTIGYQYPECKMEVGPGGPSFEQVYRTVLSSNNYNCTLSGCHGTGAPPAGAFDLGTVDKAYTTLLGASGQGGMQSNLCAMNPAPYVKPGDPAGSYLIAKLGGGGAFCLSQMPVGSAPVSAADLDLLRQWIMMGARR